MERERITASVPVGAMNWSGSGDSERGDRYEQRELHCSCVASSRDDGCPAGGDLGVVPVVGIGAGLSRAN